jgi:tRNA(fMet)-specific endonuclease VapC
MLDTSICIYLINARPQRVMERFKQERMGSIGISSVTAAELAFGVDVSGTA